MDQNNFTISEELLKPFMEEMAATPQDSIRHGEGDVLTHTSMVVDALKGLEYYRDLSVNEKEILAAAAMLHDIGKIKTTKVFGEHIEAPKHAPLGAHLAREYLWKSYGLCGSAEKIRFREAICLLIQHHSLPLHIIEDAEGSRKLHRSAANTILVPEFSNQHLLALSRADVLGRKCNDKEELLLKLDLCEEIASSEGCLTGCYPFPDSYTRYKYINGAEIWKDQRLHCNKWGEIVMMSGLPGTGKDTWINRNMADMPVISLDEIRKLKKISPVKNQGIVASIAREEAKKYLRNKQPFVWNATNITKDLRSSLISLFESYGANVRIVYLETDWETLQRRNSNREDQVPQEAINRMLGKLSVPQLHEAYKVEWHAV